MHEMGIAMQIIEVSASAIPEAMKGVAVEAVNLKIGRLTAVVPESLRFCFGVASRDTALAGAKLNIEEVPIVVRCTDCGAETTISEAKFVCGECGSGKLDVVSGRELTVTSIELAEDPPVPSEE